MRGSYLLFLCGFVLSACCPEVDPVVVPISLSEIELENWSGTDPVQSENATVPIANYTLVVHTIATGAEDFTAEPLRAFLKSPDCDPPQPELSMNFPVQRVLIRTVQPLTEDLPAGTDVTALFDTRIINKNPLRAETEITDLPGIDLEVLNAQIISRTDAVQIRKQEPFRFVGLALRDLEIDTVRAQFEITYFLTTITAIADTSAAVLLVK